MSLHAKRILNAIPDVSETEFQRVKNPRDTAREHVEIYSSDQMKKLLGKALEWDVRLIPAVAIGAFCGVRPDEIHGENVEWEPLRWEDFNMHDHVLHVGGARVRGLATRDVPLNAAIRAWLAPFEQQTGAIWNFEKSYSRKMRELHEKAEVPRCYDGTRHSFCSYRIRVLKGDLAAVAYEMGNSPAQIVSHYRRNVTDQQAKEWFSLMPPAGYARAVKHALRLLAEKA